jgi:DNA polymerase
MAASDDSAARLEAIAAEVRDHGGCGFEACEAATHMVPGDGPAAAEVVFVGEAPGASEDKQGRPFVGSAGRLLAELLADAGLERSDVYVTNVVKARPPGNRDPRKDEVAHHEPWLVAELEALAPRAVVPLGRHALAHFAPDLKISEAHGRPVERDGRVVFPWYHPAAALHNQGLRETLRADAQALGRWLGNPSGVPTLES